MSLPVHNNQVNCLTDEGVKKGFGMETLAKSCASSLNIRQTAQVFLRSFLLKSNFWRVSKKNIWIYWKQHAAVSLLALMKPSLDLFLWLTLTLMAFDSLTLMADWRPIKRRRHRMNRIVTQSEKTNDMALS